MRVCESASAAPLRRAAPLFSGAIPFLLTMLFFVGLARPIAADAPGKPADKAACVPISVYGTRSDGTDATRAIQRAIDAAKSLDARCLYIPAGKYSTSQITVHGGVKMIGDGDESVLYAPDPANRQMVGPLRRSRSEKIGAQR